MVEVDRWRVSMLRKIGYAALFFAGFLVVGSGFVFGITEVRLGHDYDPEVRPHDLTLPSDEASIELGRRVAVSRGCTDCHGEDLSGQPVIEDAVFAKVYASNLTRGEGGVADQYDAALWARAIRNGVGADGRGLVIMPAPEYQTLSDEDVGALVAWIESRPPVDHIQPKTSVGPLGRILFLAGKVPLVPAELVDHTVEPVATVERGVTVEYGRYLAGICTGCHGTGFNGGKAPGSPPDYPPAANLTPDMATGLGAWSEADFMRALREGVRPDGTEIDGRYMPWRAAAGFTDDEIRAIWMFLESLPATAEGNR